MPARRKAAPTPTPESDDDANAVRTAPALSLAPPAGTPIELLHGDIHPTKDNPRTLFDAAKLAELAASIAVRGVLQPLVVIEGDDGRFIIDDGERRWRAIGALIKDGTWPADRKVACSLRAVSGDLALVDSLIANVQRVDLSPLEQGKAYKRLQEFDAEAYSTGKIAALIGVDRRYIQQRLALVENLAPTVQGALAEGKIAFAQARELAAVPASLQQRLVKKIASGQIVSEDRLRDEIERERVPVGKAIFDLAPHAAQIVKDGKGRQYFADAELFDKLQRAAAKDKARALAKAEGWAFGDVVVGYSYCDDYQLDAKSDDKSKAGIVLHIERWSRDVKTHKGVLPRARAQGGRAGAAPKDKDAEKAAKQKRRTREALGKEQTAAAESVRERIIDAIARDPDVALRVLLFEMLSGFCGHGMIRLDYSKPGPGAFTGAAKDTPAAKLAATFKPYTDQAPHSAHAPEDRARLWDCIAGIAERDLTRAIAAVVGNEVTLHAYGPVKKIDPLLVGVAAMAGVELPPVLQALVAKPKTPAKKGKAARGAAKAAAGEGVAA